MNLLTDYVFVFSLNGQRICIQNPTNNEPVLLFIKNCDESHYLKKLTEPLLKYSPSIEKLFEENKITYRCIPNAKICYYDEEIEIKIH